MDQAVKGKISPNLSTCLTLASQAPLECFHQLGGLEYCNVDEAAESRIYDDWHKSNYVLVRNVDDDSIWVLWRKYRYAEGSADLVLAKDVFDADEYAVFPGMRGLEETIIYAKIADHWNLLDASLDLGFSRIFRASSSRNRVEEPVVVLVVRTKEGGLRRLNDYRIMGPRKDT